MKINISFLLNSKNKSIPVFKQLCRGILRLFPAVQSHPPNARVPHKTTFIRFGRISDCYFSLAPARDLFQTSSPSSAEPKSLPAATNSLLCIVPFLLHCTLQLCVPPFVTPTAFLAVVAQKCPCKGINVLFLCPDRRDQRLAWV